MSIGQKYKKGYVEYQFDHGPFLGTILLSKNVEDVRKIRNLFAKLLSRTLMQQIVKSRKFVVGMIQVTFCGSRETFAVVADDFEFVAVNVDSEEDCKEMIEAMLPCNSELNDNAECTGIDHNPWRN